MAVTNLLRCSTLTRSHVQEFHVPGIKPTTPKAPSGLSTGLQPGGTAPAKSPAAGIGSIGTGGGSTADRESGTVKRSGAEPADKHK